MPRGRPRKNPQDVLIRSAELIGWALGGIEREIVETRNRLAALTAQAAELRSRVGLKGPGRPAAAPAAAGAGEVPPVTGRKRRRRTMSPEARKRLSEMMKKRWAERKKASK
ncbi:MAG TPA: hypothetical protein VFK57_14630 [Vicinamibacterales bacterium]|nr:hypothetical protein [Vicinamibacterales bacterium]